MKGNFHVRFGERGGETRWSQDQRLRSAPTLRSGTFLLGAYQFLLDWHLKWYLEHEPEKWAAGKQPAIYQSKDGWRLTTAKKKEILLNNIYAVDIDPQAVEVTKLSLLLKVLEGESNETIGSQLALFQERVLPDLGRNIKCGNSLIGYDYFEGRMFVEQAERERVNAFDWQAEFPQVFAQGGFDAVFGNPPYIRIQVLQETSSINVEYYKKTYKAASKGNYDIYVVFVERALSLLNENGRLGFILPHKFFNAQYGEPLRSVIAKGKHLAKVVHFGDQQVFENATTYTCLMFLDRAGHDEFEFEKVSNLDSWQNSLSDATGLISATKVNSSEWNFGVGKDVGLFDRLSNMPFKLGNVADRMAQGIRTSANEVYVLEKLLEEETFVKAHSDILNKDVLLERKSLSLFLQGREIKRYRIIPSIKMVLVPYRIKSGKAELISEKELQKQFPKSYEYFRENKNYLEKREKGRFRGGSWYMYGRQQNIDLMLVPKILIPDISDRAQFALDEKGEYAFTSGYGITLKDDSKLSPKYVLGLLNSKLLEFYLKRVSTPMQNGFFRFFTQFIEKLPIRPINFSDPADVARHDKMVSLVERMLELYNPHRPASRDTSPKFQSREEHGTVSAEFRGGGRTPQEQEMVKREIESTDKAIDKLVYELYGLTEDEIKIVEGEK